MVTDDEILERMMYPMINEGARILEEGIAARPSDIDVVWLYGYGWPIYRGGPMFWADSVGLKHIADRLVLLRQGDQRSLAGARAAAEAPRRRRQDLCLAGGREVESGVMELVALFVVIPGRAKGEPGISRFRVRCCASSRNDGRPAKGHA